MNPADTFLKARDFLIGHREDYEAAYQGFHWPRLEFFNWALDYFDVHARGNPGLALWVLDESGKEVKRSFAQMSERSDQVANFLRDLGMRRGDRLLILLPNIAPLWEATLAAIKLGVVVSPAPAMLTTDDLHDRIERGKIRYAITDPAGAEMLEEFSAQVKLVVVGASATDCTSYANADAASTTFTPESPTRADDPFLLYFTSGTTAKPKMVLHTHVSYPIGHLSTMYWLGLKAGDVHLNISSPGWAKHAWSSFFGPWNAGACILVFNYVRFDARKMLDVLSRIPVTTLCAAPTVWRMLVLEDLAATPVRVRELISAGEPLNPEVIERVRAAWGITIREGYGQTETTALIGNSPGQTVKPGSMGRPLPGYRVVLLDDAGHEGADGDIAVRLKPRPLGMMTEYADNAERTEAALGGDFYHTADTASCDRDGYYWYVGRSDDVFKSAGYRISPFELESALVEHPAVAEAAVVPRPDVQRLNVPKAYVALRPGVAPSRETALAIFRFARERLAPYKRIRQIEFGDLPKTISGKIRRAQLRKIEAEHRQNPERREHEYLEEDFPELRGEAVAGGAARDAAAHECGF